MSDLVGNPEDRFSQNEAQVRKVSENITSEDHLCVQNNLTIAAPFKVHKALVRYIQVRVKEQVERNKSITTS